MPNGAFTLEQRLLFACIARDSQQVSKILRNAQNHADSKIDWNTLYKYIDLHKVASAVLNGLQDGFQDGVQTPEIAPRQFAAQFIAQLKRFVESQKRFNYALTLEMKLIADKFRAAGIPILFFKGPTLSIQLHGDIYSRRFNDIDFLIHPDQFNRAVELLQSEGYFPSQPLPTKLIATENHYQFKHNVRQSSVELHWALTKVFLRFPLSFEMLSESAVQIEVLGTPVYAPSPEDMILFLCVHGTKHNWDRLAWLVDIVAFLRAYPTFDWESTLRRAESLYISRMVLVALYLASHLLHAELPDTVSRRIAAQPKIAQLAEYVMLWFFDVDYTYYFEKHVFQLKIRQRMIDKLVYVKEKQPFLEYGVPQYIPDKPSRDHTLYYLLWANRLVRKHAIRPVLHLLRKA
jgi:hypothetical protein